MHFTLRNNQSYRWLKLHGQSPRPFHKTCRSLRGKLEVSHCKLFLLSWCSRNSYGLVSTVRTSICNHRKMDESAQQKKLSCNRTHMHSSLCDPQPREFNIFTEWGIGNPLSLWILLKRMGTARHVQIKCQLLWPLCTWTQLIKDK